MRIIALLLIVFSLPLSAQKSSKRINVVQYVRNSFTKHGILNAFVTVMREDSTVIDTMRTRGAGGSHNAHAWFWKAERRTQNIIVKVEHPEYETHIGTYEVKNYGRNKGYNLPELFMKRKPKGYKDLEQMMDEVVVEATKVKVVYKNDTIIYNADAFNVPDGSMLDGLIRQFPGAELKENGEIFINGKKIDYLTLNGKDFMKGNNQIMLENLPYYTVQKVRVFNKPTENSELLGHDVEKKDYVMDVELKKQYCIGYMANVLLGGGTHKTWNSRLFGMRFTDNSRIVLMGNANNINENKYVDLQGNYHGDQGHDGILTTRKTFLNIMVDDKNGKFKEDATIGVRSSTHSTEQQTAQQTFLQNGDIYSRRQAVQENNTLTIEAKNALTLKSIGLTIKTNATYTKQDNSGSSRDATFNSTPDIFGDTKSVLDSMFAPSLRPELFAIAINRTSNSSASDLRKFHIDNDFRWSKSLPWGDDVILSFKARYHNNESNIFDRYSLDYIQNKVSSEFQNKYSLDRQRGYSYTANALYSIQLPTDWNINFNYNFQQEYNNRDYNHHRLDRLGGDWKISDTDNFGLLPSSHEQMTACLDAKNSYTSGYMQRKQRGALTVHRYKYWREEGLLDFEVFVPFYYVSERNHYVRDTLNTVVRNSSWLFMPAIHLEYENDKWHNRWTLDYKLDMTTPDLMQMVDIRDTSEPLVVKVGNPSLKGASTHLLNASYQRRFRKTGHTLRIESGAKIMSDLVVNGFTYDRATGIYTFKPENINGNWNGHVGLNYRGDMDKAKRFSFETNTRYNYYRNVDLASEVGSEASRRSKVDNHIIAGNLKFGYKCRKLRVDVLSSANWNQSRRGEGSVSNDLNAVDFSYGLTGQYELPYKIQLSTNLTVQSRRGYDELSMNTDNVVWNASVSRSFLKEKLNLRAEAFDILHQLSQTSYVVNGQGRTETWRRTLPNYFMLNLTWKFNVNPKGKR